jgi:hypothetical protein
MGSTRTSLDRIEGGGGRRRGRKMSDRRRRLPWLKLGRSLLKNVDAEVNDYDARYDTWRVEGCRIQVCERKKRAKVGGGGGGERAAGGLKQMADVRADLGVAGFSQPCGRTG